MAEKNKTEALQNKFLKNVCIHKNDKSAESKTLTVFLVNGVKLTGTVADFDDDTLLLVREGHAQLIYKHAISTIMPAHPLKLTD